MEHDMRHRVNMHVHGVYAVRLHSQIHGVFEISVLVLIQKAFHRMIHNEILDADEFALFPDIPDIVVHKSDEFVLYAWAEFQFLVEV